MTTMAKQVQQAQSHPQVATAASALTCWRFRRGGAALVVLILSALLLTVTIIGVFFVLTDVKLFDFLTEPLHHEEEGADEDKDGGDGQGGNKNTTTTIAEPTSSPVDAVAMTNSPSLFPYDTVSTVIVDDENKTTNEEQPTPDIFGPYPLGPYILADQSSESITIPYPQEPTNTIVTSQRTNCPHLLDNDSNNNDMMNWHDPSTWLLESSFFKSSQPSEGQDITIPEGTRILVNRTIVEKLGIVYIPPTSELIIGEDPSSGNGIAINVHGFDVQGKLTIGSETCRLVSPVTITLHGQRPSNAVFFPPSPNIKGISVEGGTLSMHGKRYYHTWTRLAKTVQPGDNVLVLQHTVNWEAGQQIVIVTSSIKDSRDYNQNEVRIIKSVHPDPPAGVGAIVYLTTAIQYSHLANKHYQVEVGLLSRMITVQGAEDDSEPNDPDPLDGSCMHDMANSKNSIYYNTSIPCMDKELTGYGGHIMVHQGGVGHVEGVELYRMGQTNVLARYPMHFHLLGECPTCYFRDSSVHRSFYRCVSIHGTNNIHISENVAYNAIGFCYYMEDGVEQENKISFNLAAHIHTIGPEIPTGRGQITPTYVQGPNLTLPADVAASGFYISNVHNHIQGNAASGGWSGFAFPSLSTPLETFREMKYRPSNAVGLTLDGNTAHSTGWWWYHASPFYIGGALYYNKDDLLEYIPGRSTVFGRDNRNPCHVNTCEEPFNYCGGIACPPSEYAWLRMTNSKAFLSAGVGLNSWSGRMEVIGFESHDVRLAMESLSAGFWIDKLLSVCRTGESLGLPSPKASNLEGSGFFWYDTAQEHIMTDSIFRNCGYRSDVYDQYDQSPDRGCEDNDYDSGCSKESTVFGFLTHSDKHTPEVMQGTRNITFDNCGRRFKLSKDDMDTVSGRGQNWLDVDGSVSGLNEETFIASGLEGSKDWWGIEDDVIYDEQAPLRFIKKNKGPVRSLAHIRVEFDDSLHDQVGSSACLNGMSGIPCPSVGYVRHLGHKFSSMVNNNVSRGLPLTANPDVVGLAGGYGWLLDLNGTAPRTLRLVQAEVDPDTTLTMSIPYPVGTQFVISAMASRRDCHETSEYSCSMNLTAVETIEDVKDGLGDTYHVDDDGVLTIRIIQTPSAFIGNPDWIMPTYKTPGRDGIGHALSFFARDGVLLPRKASSGTKILIRARCPSDDNDVGYEGSGYCPEFVKEDYDPTVCNDGYEQVAYDTCCQVFDPSKCMYSDGSRNFDLS